MYKYNFISVKIVFLSKDSKLKKYLILKDLF